MHAKRIAQGKGKGIKWGVSVRSSHKRSKTLSLTDVIRDMGYADNAREARKIIYEGYVEVDGKPCKDPSYGLGLMDVLAIPKIKKAYRVISGKNRIELSEIPEKDSKSKLCGVIGKTTLAGKKIQINLHDGKNVLFDQKVSVGDTVIFDLKTEKITTVLPYAKGNQGLIISGIHTGETGKIEEILEGTVARKSLTTINGIQTLSKYIFIIGTDKAVI